VPDAAVWLLGYLAVGAGVGFFAGMLRERTLIGP
jgi:hypothetical protein